MATSLIPLSAKAGYAVTTIADVQGTPPYLTFDGGMTKVTTTEGLLGITLSDGTVITASSDNSSSASPIILPNENDTFASITTMVPLSTTNADYPSVSLNELVNTYSYWGDSDGDTNPTATGSLTVNWLDVNGTDITNTVKTTPDTALGGCDAPYIGPYQLTVSSTDGSLSTQYGDPSTSYFTQSTKSYYLQPPVSGSKVCYIQPNLNYGTGVYAGSTTQWNPAKGFLVQDVNTPSRNFPTTGFNQAFFDILLNGVLGSSVTATKVSGSSNISLTLTPNPNGAGANIVRVTLNGPSFASPGSSAFTATTFKLSAGSTDLYSFTLKQWFIARKNTDGNYSNSASYCASVAGGNYRMMAVRDLTNATGEVGFENPNNPNENYQRQIGGGLFSEWGVTSFRYYTESDFNQTIFWTSDKYGSTSQYIVNSATGEVSTYDSNNIYVRSACVSK
ncbi:hypothetical protein [Orbus hercynius]|uniref:hypothetical protein n=1 Tax=Orbus hercynius TaxID=593135 RepID=UPI0011C49CAE|nr:hypothetical protein [Orbus hercynius]